MNAADQSELLPVSQGGCDTTTDSWYQAIARTGDGPPGAIKVCQGLAGLSEQTIALLLTDSLDHGQAEVIGASLAQLHYIEPQVSDRTQELPAQQLQDLPADQVVALQPRLAALLGGLASGFFQQTRQAILAEQKQIRKALISELQQTEEALQRAHDKVERRVQEHTAELAVINKKLRREITERKRMEGALRKARTELERRVEKRTAELTMANEQLKQEIDERKRMKKILLHFREEMLRNHHLLLALSRAAQAVQRARTPEEVYRIIGDEVTGLGHHAMIFALTDDHEHVILSHTTFESAWLRTVEKLSGLSVLGSRFPLAPDGLFQRVIAGGESAFCERTVELVAQGVPRLGRSLIERLIEMLGIERSIYAPLRVGGETHGLLGVASTDLTKADVAAVTLLANQASIAIENVRSLEQIGASRERMRRLAQQVVSTQEEERRRWSRALHDEAGQALTALKISLELIGQDLPAEFGPLRQRLSDAAALTMATMEQIRLLAQDLRPPALDAVGLNSTLAGFCRDFAKRTQLPIDYLGLELPMLPEAVNTCLYRFLQEALTNVAKHACANQVHVALRCDAETVSLSVEDDGRGFDPHARWSASAWPMGIGLLGMQERIESLGGRLEIESRPGQGTRLVAHLPAGGIP